MHVKDESQKWLVRNTSEFATLNKYLLLSSKTLKKAWPKWSVEQLGKNCAVLAGINH